MEVINGRHLFGCSCPGCLDGGLTDPEAASLDPRAGATYGDKIIFDLGQVTANLNRTGDDWYTGNYGELDDNVLDFGFWLNIEELQNSYYVNEEGTIAFNEAFYAEDFSTFTVGQTALARTSIGLWDDLIAISFRETRSGAADITFGNTFTGGAQAYAYLPFGDVLDADYEAALGFKEVGRLGGDIWIDGFVASNFNPLTPSYYAQTTMIHELGHSLGLSHPGNYNATDDNDGDGEPDPITYANDAFFAQDSAQYSIMSYFDAYETGAQHIDWSLTNFAYAATPLVHDIAAIQAIYGQDMTTRASDTVYGFNSTADRSEFDFDINNRPIVAIWDGGGNDTLDFSGWETRSVINLNAGAFSSGGGIDKFLTLEEVNANRAAIGFAPRSQATFDFYEGLKAQLGLTSGLFTDNISIAYGATIENAIGGGGNDRIIVNQVANRVDGGDGTDTVSYSTATEAVRIALDGLAGSRGAGGDVLVNVENLEGSKFNDTLTGNAGANRLDGGVGNDRLTGGEGADRFVFGTDGAAGVDRITDFAAVDVIIADKAVSGRNLSRGANGVFTFDTDGDKILFEGTPPTTLRFLGEDNGSFYYGDGGVRPVAAGSGQRVFESLMSDEVLAGSRAQGTTDIFFYDTANAARDSGDDVLTFTARDLFVTTTRLDSTGSGNQISLDNGEVDLTGHGGSVQFRNANGALNGLEFDGMVNHDGVDYYVYSTIGSSVGAADLVFGSGAAA